MLTEEEDLEEIRLKRDYPRFDAWMEALQKEDDVHEAHWAYLRENVLKGVDWRNDWFHNDVYNRECFLRGYLDKFEQIRKAPGVEVLEDYITLCFVCGFSSKRMYCAVQHLIEEKKIPVVLTMAQIKWFLRSKKFRVNRVKREFEEGAKNERMKIFQGLYTELFDVEKQHLEILLSKVRGLQQELAETDPSEEPTKFAKIRRQIEGMLDTVKAAHGVTDMRKKAVEIAAEQAVESIQKKLEEAGDSGKGAIETFAEVVQGETFSESHMLEEKSL